MWCASCWQWLAELFLHRCLSTTFDGHVTIPVWKRVFHLLWTNVRSLGCRTLFLVLNGAYFISTVTTNLSLLHFKYHLLRKWRTSTSLNSIIPPFVSASLFLFHRFFSSAIPFLESLIFFPCLLSCSYLYCNSRRHGCWFHKYLSEIPSTHSVSIGCFIKM